MGQSTNLNEYLREVKDKPFSWGKHDCLTFSNSAFKSYHGWGWAEDYLGTYLDGTEPLIPSKLKKKYKVSDWDDLIPETLEEIDYVPPKGSLVATKKVERWMIGYSLGISLGLKAAFVGRKGLQYLPIDNIDRAWIPE